MSEGTLRCDACGIVFPKAALLETHRAKFCEGSLLHRKLLQRKKEVDSGLTNQRLDAETIVVVTDAYHTHRAQRAFAQHFDEVGALGVRSPPRTRWKGAMREVLAIAYHSVKGDL